MKTRFIPHRILTYLATVIAIGVFTLCFVMIERNRQESNSRFNNSEAESITMEIVEREAERTEYFVKFKSIHRIGLEANHFVSSAGSSVTTLNKMISSAKIVKIEERQDPNSTSNLYPYFVVTFSSDTSLQEAEEIIQKLPFVEEYFKIAKGFLF